MLHGCPLWEEAGVASWCTELALCQTLLGTQLSSSAKVFTFVKTYLRKGKMLHSLRKKKKKVVRKNCAKPKVKEGVEKVLKALKQRCPLQLMEDSMVKQYFSAILQLLKHYFNIRDKGHIFIQVYLYTHTFKKKNNFQFIFNCFVSSIFICQIKYYFKWQHLNLALLFDCY